MNHDFDEQAYQEYLKTARKMREQIDALYDKANQCVTNGDAYAEIDIITEKLNNLSSPYPDELLTDENDELAKLRD